MIKAIIFDCFGVLYHGSLRHLVEMAPEEKRLQVRDLSRASDRGYVTREEYLRGVAELTGSASEEIERIIDSNHVRNESLMEYAKSLKSEYKIGMLSNVGQNVMPRIFTQHELNEVFDAVVLSSEVHMVKPQPEMYEYIAGRLRVPIESCVMVDDLIENVEGARQAGMLGLLFTDTDTLKTELGNLMAVARDA